MIVVETVDALTDEGLLETWTAGRHSNVAERAELLLATAGVRVPPDELTLGALDAHLLDLRAAVFGPRVELTADCPACGDQLQTGFDIDDVRVGGERSDALLEVATSDEAYRVLFRLPTLADLRVLGGAASVDEARLTLVRRCVVDARLLGTPVDANSLPDEAVQLMADVMAANDGQADVRFAMACPTCRHEWEARFDVGAFVWTEIDARARRLIVDVHTLATAYGWSEPDVLRLPPARRQAYVDLVLG